VYVVDAGNGNPSSRPVLSIGAVPDTGIADGEGNVTGCFPNQLYAAAVNGGRLYVTSMCASPRGPLGETKVNGVVTSQNNFKTLVHPAVFVIDTTEGAELPERGKLLDKALDDIHALEPDAAVVMPLIPNGIAFGRRSPGAQVDSAFVSAFGADAVFRLDYDASGVLRTIGDAGARFMSVNSGTALPVGLAVSRKSAAPYALVLNDGSQQVSILDLGSPAAPATTVDATTEEASPRAQRLLGSHETLGRHLFATGRGVWSYNGEARSSCESCHPNGGSDGVVWSFARGPRRTLSTAATYEKTTSDPALRQQRLLLWGANIDEVHDVEAIVRGVSGGVGGVLWNYVPSGPAGNECRLLYGTDLPGVPLDTPCSTIGYSHPQAAKFTSTLRNALNGSLAATMTGDHCPEDQPSCDSAVALWGYIDDFIRSLRAPTALRSLDPDDIKDGHELFLEAKCAGCHGGPGWTVSRLFYTPGPDANGALPHAPPAELPSLGWLRTSSYAWPQGLPPLNPAATGPLPFRPSAPPERSATTADLIAFYYDAATATDDQLLCALRQVGTFSGEGELSKAVPGAPQVRELRANAAPAQGRQGMNVPSLLGMSVAAPYFHAGNARTLEEVFDSATFHEHHQALAPGFLDKTADPLGYADKVRRLVAYLLSIDGATPTEPIPDGMDACVH
jgi:cytochrome c peroxidase